MLWNQVFSRVATFQGSHRLKSILRSAHRTRQMSTSNAEMKSVIQERLNDYCRFAVNRDWEGLGQIFTHDAKLLNPGSPNVIVGREAIVSIFQSSPVRYTKKTAEVESIEYSSGSEVAAHSNYKNYIADKLINTTKDITAWRLTEGTWAIYLDIFTADPPRYFEEIVEKTKLLMCNYNNERLTEVPKSYAANCIFMRQNKPKIVGREGVLKAYSEFNYVERFYDTVQTVHGISDDIIHSTGTVVLLDKFGHQLEKLKYVRLWKRIDGQLLIEWDNANPA